MKSITQVDLLKALELHKRWLATAEVEGERADLRGANLGGAYLGGATGVLRLSFSHQWDLVLVQFTDAPRVGCGCRWFDSPGAARAHWRTHKSEQRRQIVLPALSALLAVARAQGWAGCDDE